MLVQARLAAAAAQDESEVTAGFGEQVPAVEPAAVVHHEHRRGDVDGRQRYVDHGGNPRPDGRRCGTGVLEKGIDDLDGHSGGPAKMSPIGAVR
ncbi:hypothetical protein ABT288_37350 [Streptomyces sp. NPDC001093]|uniref:hypothetical protein n=1 Tax=Streptomyces sp. NPDC001093 TaxID=3154376 RepID=UPI003325A4BB